MSLDQIEQAIDSLKGFPEVIGIMGGEPLLHPEFDKVCSLVRKKVPYLQAGLWTSLPEGKEHYREEIVNTFGNIFINDHSRNDILHQPVLVAARDAIKNSRDMWYFIDKCWVQMAWSASINPKGAFFCEVAAAFAMVFGTTTAWKVEPGWWTRNPIDFHAQMLEFCPGCGCAMPLLKRYSNEIVDDISESNLARLSNSPKIKAVKYVISDLQLYRDNRTSATYKELQWRNEVASRYGIFLMNNYRNYCTPYLKKDWRYNYEKETRTQLQQ